MEGGNFAIENNYIKFGSNIYLLYIIYIIYNIYMFIPATKSYNILPKVEH